MSKIKSEYILKEIEISNFKTSSNRWSEFRDNI